MMATVNDPLGSVAYTCPDKISMTGMEGLYPVLSFPICSTTGGEREPTFDKIVKNGALEMPTV